MTTEVRGQVRVGLAARVEQCEADLIRLWQCLGPDGPTFANPLAGTPQQTVDRYLRPLARLLRGALAGSPEHTAIYLDERMRYAEGGDGEAVDATGRCVAALAVELPLLAELLVDGTEPTSGVLEALTLLHRPLGETQRAVGRVLFVGDCLFVETRAFLQPRARGAGRPLDVRQVFFSSNQGLAGGHRAITEEIRRFRPDLIGVSLFTFEGVPAYRAAWQRAAVPGHGRSQDRIVPLLVGMVRDLLSEIRTVSDTTVVVHAPLGLPLDPLRRRISRLPPRSRSQRRLLSALRTGLAELVDSTENTILFDEEQVVGAPATAVRLRELGGPVFDPADVPIGYAHTTRLGPAVAARYDRIAAELETVGRAKAVLVDFDNTLWSGVMAEGPVVHDRALQTTLRELKEAGILLVALSKNDASSIRWSELALRPDDFVLHKIDWRSKPDNVSEAVAELDLAPGAFVLLDDNPVERALVTEQVPGVRAVDPADPGTLELMRHWLEFPSTRQTAESRRRTEIYREAAERRRSISTGHDYPTMMRSLRLRAVARPAVIGDLDRLIELVQRTNQFNTTTRRRSADDLRVMIDDPSLLIVVLQLRDRFGDLGVVAVAVFDRERRCFDSVIMSCRAMGFGVEQAVLRVVIDAAGPGDLTGEFVPTERNSPAASLFADAGFSESSGGRWVLAAGAPRPPLPEWIRLEVAMSAV